MRAYITEPVVGFLKPRLIDKHAKGPARGFATTMLNVGVSSPITGAIAAALFTNPDDFADVYITALATTMPMSVVASFFIVGPIVKLICHNRIKPENAPRALQTLQHCAPAIERLLGM